MPAEPRGIHRRTQFEISSSLTARFWLRVQLGTESECWPWVGAHRNGYGAIKHGRQVLSSHVVAYVLHHGPVPAGLIITHTCDNRICCNPRHLKAGTFADNVVDMHSRRIIAAPRGVEVANHILTPELVMRIRAFRRDGVGSAEIAKRLNVTLDSVRGVVSGRNWRHIA
jgi:hypothetical protein